MKETVERGQKEEVLCQIWGNAVWRGRMKIPVNLWGCLIGF